MLALCALSLSLAPAGPLQIVQRQLACLQRGDDHDFDEFFEYVDPKGAFAVAHATSASDGPVARLRWTMRREPRWKSIGSRPMAALLHHKAHEVVRGTNRGYVDESTFRCSAKVMPYFPDAPAAESTVTYSWLLRRQMCGTLANPETLWMVDQIEPVFGAWAVDDPISVGRQRVIDSDGVARSVDAAAARRAWIEARELRP